MRTPKNHGTWRKTKVTADNLDTNLVFELRGVQAEGDGKIRFSVFLAFDATIEVEQQNWENGVRLLSTSLRAHVRPKLTLDCEVETRSEGKGSGLPDIVFKLRVTKADLRYDNLVVEHVAGVGGSGARLLGEAVRKGIKRFHPAVEEHLLAKADAAIVKAADAREVRLSLGQLFKGLPTFGGK
jgi:hypothetical protein